MSNSQKLFDRRDFLKKSSLIAVAVSFSPLQACRDKKGEPDPDPDCLTTDDILGPFYKAGAPFTDHIIPYGLTLPLLIIEGRVLTDCTQPIPDAIVEIWNADDQGAYDTSDEFRFRGRFKTLDDGKYSFTTIIPGRYLNGSRFRPSHIHFRITAPGYQELVSQIYFKEDPYIPTDPWASAEKAKERILTISKDDGGTDIVNFDIHLRTIE